MLIKDVIKSMTLEEKAFLCSGKDYWHTMDIERLNIPEIMLSDGPHGLRKQRGDEDHLGLNHSVPATCLPTAVTTASSWDKELMKEIGVVLGEECLQEGISVILGPGANIKRSPLCGRNFEYISEDPFLTGEMAAAMINGIQSKGVGTSLKHYAVNNQETRRMKIDAVVDERALREIYLAGFETAIKKSQPWTVMGAYNKVYGTYCCENKKLLNNILREEWGFEGLVVTDWGACNDRVEGLKAGQDLEMPSSQGINNKRIIEAVKSGQLDEDVLDRAVERLLKLIFKSEENKKEDSNYDKVTHHDLARKAAIQSIVLLKNEENILPLKKNCKIALVGELAQKPRYQGAGSSLVTPTRLENVFDELKSYGIDFEYSKGYDINDDEPKRALIEEACKFAKTSDIVLVFAGLTEKYESEGYDRQHMRIPESHNQLIRNIAKENRNVVVVLSGGSPVEMPWIEQVKGILNSYLSGQAGASAIIQILFGEANPSGKLAETYPIKLSDNPSYNYFGKGKVTEEYRESIYVGYRYYDASNTEVLFPFGYGLSYTKFEYSNIQLSKANIKDIETVKVSLKVKNTGPMAGAEIIQLYVSDLESTIFRPKKELKGFDKVFLKPGEEKIAEFTLDRRSFAYYNVDINDWHVEEGDFEILIGASSNDIRLRANIYVGSTQLDVKVPNYRETSPTYYDLKSGGFEVDSNEFKSIYGRKLPASIRSEDEEFTINSSLEEIKSTFIGKILMKFAKKHIREMLDTDDENDSIYKMTWSTIMESPLRTMVQLGDGAISMDMMNSIIKLANRKYVSGIGMILSSLLKNK